MAVVAVGGRDNGSPHLVYMGAIGVVPLPAAEHEAFRRLILPAHCQSGMVKEELFMDTAIISPEFHVAIPPAIREALDLQPG